jgi:galactose mutarotase-like enzyme
MYYLENEYLKIAVASLGAELQSVRCVKTDTEYLWNGDPKFWTGRAPVLFPIVGAVKDGEYRLNGKTYKMPQHGFARKAEFAVTTQTDSYIAFETESTEETLACYPYAFSLKIIYELNGNTLSTKYIVTNKDNGDMYFSIGAHPAFVCPFDGNYLEFNEKETSGVHTILPGGLVTLDTKPFLYNESIIELKHELFETDALVFSNLKSDKLSLKSRKNDGFLTMTYSGFPYMGIWTKVGAPYICLEPWYGVADPPEFSGELSDKPGIMKLDGNGVFECEHVVEFNPFSY